MELFKKLLSNRNRLTRVARKNLISDFKSSDLKESKNIFKFKIRLRNKKIHRKIKALKWLFFKLWGPISRVLDLGEKIGKLILSDLDETNLMVYSFIWHSGNPDIVYYPK